MAPVICFIDDSKFELEVFNNNIIPAAPDVEFILGSTYEDVKSKIGNRHPCLFLLDLYGTDSETRASIIPPRNEIEKEIEAFGSLDAVYRGLDDVQGDKTNEYLKRLFFLTDSWRNLFYRTSRKCGQSIQYGAGNLALVQRDYTAAATIAYTRKSVIMDAVAILNDGIDGICLKPNGPDDDSIHKATSEAAPVLLETWYETISRRFTAYLKDVIIFIIRSGYRLDPSALIQLDDLPAEIRDLLGPGEINFLKAAAEWWRFTGVDPIL